jgi:triosephosphate isomerase
MNNTLAVGRALVAAVREGLASGTTVEVGIAPSAVLLMPMCRAVADSPIQLGAQNVYCEPSGAFTGETSPAMLVDAGCRFVIVGHSERRSIFGEAGALLRRKVAAATDAGLSVIFCIGETLDQRERGETNDVLEQQLGEVLVGGTDWRKITVAYEPVWAIGTGRNATADQVQAAHECVRGWLNEKYGDAASADMRIQYGGSVKPSNAHELMKMPDVDGALVGGASLSAEDFLAIIRATEGS